MIKTEKRANALKIASLGKATAGTLRELDGLALSASTAIIGLLFSQAYCLLMGQVIPGIGVLGKSVLDVDYRHNPAPVISNV